ncbi:hypothetical protein K2173_020507 [Erythroxylum novogranatense]|uniref:Delta(3)-Delta(2)-enoyl-CoA isomerase n=1 Tax=Erythroxylum novogranatense TaxID=1862640 RepID=A0AAV8THX8_9ROSI|nr:hypothetical protein K2173_020507 [Erythroxylum novogranatense]
MCSLEKRGNIYILTLTGSDEHRLNPTLIDAIQAALSRLRSELTSSSSALVTTAQGKYFSNGYDLAWAQSSLSRLQLMDFKLQSLISDFISLPMPTIAAVTGHASAAGMILALSNDYVLMRKERGFLYMSEMDIGRVVPEWFMAMLKCKIGDANARRELIMKAVKMNAETAVERGIVYSAHQGSEETLEAAVGLAEELVKRGWDGNVYASNRLVLMREAVNKVEGKTKSKPKL